MNIKELIGKYEYLNHNFFRRVDTSEVLRDLQQLDEPQRATIPQLIADWIEQCKNNFGFNLKSAMNINTILHYSDDGHKVIDWIKVNSNQEAFARAWLDGYEVEKEPKYIVKLKGVYHGDLGYAEIFNGYSFYNKDRNPSGIKYEHTRKELEQAGFGWVFDCPGIEVEEVEE